jgi:putative flippase GtrA
MTTRGLGRWLRFNGVGAMGMGVQVGTIAFLSGACRADYRIATAVGVAAAVVHNYAWHRHWTWADRENARRRPCETLARFALTNGVVSLAGNLAVMAVLVGGAGLPPVPANLVAIVVCSLANYWLADRIVFE